MPGLNNVSANRVIVIPKPTVRFRRAKSIDTLIIGETDMKSRESPLSSKQIDDIIEPVKIEVGEDRPDGDLIQYLIALTESVQS